MLQFENKSLRVPRAQGAPEKLSLQTTHLISEVVMKYCVFCIPKLSLG